MKEICEAIDLSLSTSDNISCAGILFYGLAELMIKGKQTYPVTVNDRKQVAIDDQYDGICFHRALNISSDEPEDEQWGILANKVFSAKIRTILATKVKKFDEEFIFDFSNAIPQFLVIDGYKKIDLENVSVNTNQTAIYKEEFSGEKESDYEKHISVYNIYAIEYEANFIKC